MSALDKQKKFNQAKGKIEKINTKKCKKKGRKNNYYKIILFPHQTDQNLKMILIISFSFKVKNGQETVPSLQVSPLMDSGHRHWYWLIWSIHTPPLRHGFAAHSFLSNENIYW